MLSTFFSTSRPIHYLMVFIIVALAIISSLWWSTHTEWWSLFGIVILSACLAVFQFIVTKNDLTASSSFGLWTASLLSLLYLTFDVSFNKVIALFFILLALRRLLSIKTEYDIIKKIFDATFWIAIAAIFFHWSVLFYGVVYISVFLYVRNDYRNWATPLVAMACVWLLLFTYDYVWEQQFITSFWESFRLDYIWSYEVFTGKQFILLIVISISIIGLLIYLSKLIDIQQSVRPRFTIITFAGLCGLIIAVLDYKGFLNGGFLFLIPSLAILVARLAHFTDHKIIKEILLWSPLLLLLSSFLLY